MFFAGHAFLAEIGGNISSVTLGEFLGLLKKVQLFFIRDVEVWGEFMLYMLALVGQPSPRMVFGVHGVFRRNCRQKRYKTSFSPLFVFLLSRISGFFMGWVDSLASLDWSC